MTCEGKPEITVYDRLIEGHEVPRDAAEKSFRGAKGFVSALEAQERLVERKEAGEWLIKLLPPKKIGAANLR